MDPRIFFKTIVEPTLQWMAGSPAINVPLSVSGRILVVAVAGQESRWKDRRQIGITSYYPQRVGARSYWQLESTWGGPVAINDVIVKTPRQLASVCGALDIPVDEMALYEACAWNDTLACAMARLNLWQDPAPLPAAGDKEGAWQYYVRNWKPGVPHRSSWDAVYDQSVAAVSAL